MTAEVRQLMAAALCFGFVGGWVVGMFIAFWCAWTLGV